MSSNANLQNQLQIVEQRQQQTEMEQQREMHHDMQMQGRFIMKTFLLYSNNKMLFDRSTDNSAFRLSTLQPV